MTVTLADVDNTKVDRKEIPIRHVYFAKDRKKMHDYWESFGASIE